jgi:hypothetical protein
MSKSSASRRVEALRPSTSSHIDPLAHSSHGLTTRSETHQGRSCSERSSQPPTSSSTHTRPSCHTPQEHPSTYVPTPLM